MNAKLNDARKKSPIRKFGVWVIVVLCVLFLYIQTTSLNLLRYIPTISPKPKPPDLSQCTIIEIYGAPSLFQHIVPDAGLDIKFLSSEETQLLKSLDKVSIDDRKYIKDFAQKISSGSYEGKGLNYASWMLLERHIKLVCYRDNEIITTIKNYQPDFILTEENQRFEYKKILPKPLLHVSEDMRPLICRVFCGYLLISLYDYLHSDIQRPMSYPPHTKWCDVVKGRLKKDGIYNREHIKDIFKCPCTEKGKCHYGMNPNCKMDSPPDMVLIFETKDGWNQHGGPELFTFDNHKLKRPAPNVLPSLKRSNGGGCVLLNDGTVKFIRTEEELHALRWK